MADKFYAVKVGRRPGIYKNWIDCKNEIDGFKGAIYKSFKTEEEAVCFIEDTSTGKTKDELDTDSLIAYVDGSFSAGKEFGSGCVLIYKEEVIKELSKKYIDEDLAAMRNVAGEIKAAEMAIEFALQNDFKSITIFHDYEGIQRWPKGEWKANKTGTKAYKMFYDEVKDKIKIEFVKVKGHSGNRYNDRADELAKNALGIS